MAEEKLSQEVRDAVRAFRYYTGQTPRMLGLKNTDMSAIENGYAVTPQKALEVINKAWGFKSFDELLKAAEGLPQPPNEITPEIRDAVRAFRYYTGQTPRMLGLGPCDMSNIENGYAVTPRKALETIKKAWGFESFDELLEAAKGLPQPPARSISKAPRFYAR